MTSDQRFLAIGCYINSALYLTGCFVAGIVYDQQRAWTLSLLAVGFCFLCYLAQLFPHKAYARTLAGALSLSSIFVGALAGISFLVR